MSQDNNSQLDRLLRSAASAKSDEAPVEAPYGFDTRVVAAWRSYRANEGDSAWEFARLLKRVATTAVIVAACAGAGAAWQLQQNNDFDDATGGAYAMADNVIEANTW